MTRDLKVAIVKMASDDGRHKWCEKCIETVQLSGSYVFLNKSLSTGATWLIWFCVSELLFNHEGHQSEMLKTHWVTEQSVEIERDKALDIHCLPVPRHGEYDKWELWPEKRTPCRRCPNVQACLTPDSAKLSQNATWCTKQCSQSSQRL
jgi:hypothetical protein